MLVVTPRPYGKESHLTETKEFVTSFLQESISVSENGANPVYAVASATQSGIAPGPAMLEAIAPAVNAAVNWEMDAVEGSYYAYRFGSFDIIENIIEDFFFSPRFTRAFKQELCFKVRMQIDLIVSGCRPDSMLCWETLACLTFC